MGDMTSKYLGVCHRLAAGALLVLLALAPVQPAVAGEVLDRVMSDKKLVVATDAEYPPQSVQNPDGSFEGFDIDVATEIATRLGVDVEFVTPAWEIITAGNWGGRWDLSVGSMTPTSERSKVLSFPAIYYYTPASFFVHKDSAIAAIDDLNGKTIGACGGCTYESYMKKELVIEADGAPAFDFLVTPGEIRTYPSDINVMDDLRLGDGTRLDAGISALPTVQAAIDSGYPIKIVGDPVYYEPLAVAVDKGDPAFEEKIATIVADMRADGTLLGFSESGTVRIWSIRSDRLEKRPGSAPVRRLARSPGNACPPPGRVQWLS